MPCWKEKDEQEFHQRSREQEQRLEEARAAENLPPGETSATPASSSGDLPTGEIPDVQIEQEKVEEQEVTQEVDEEAKMYQEELQCRKEMDIFAKTPTAQYGTSQARSRRSGKGSTEELGEFICEGECDQDKSTFCEQDT